VSDIADAVSRFTYIVMGSIEARHEVAKGGPRKQVALTRRHQNGHEVRRTLEATHVSDSHFSVKGHADIQEEDLLTFENQDGMIISRTVTKVSRGPSKITRAWYGSLPAFELHSFHPLVVQAAAALWDTENYRQAITEALIVLEEQVRNRTGLASYGKRLMGEALAQDKSPVNVRTSEGMTGENEQAGFRALFEGAIVALRNPRAHRTGTDTRSQALEHLAFVSLLMRRLDLAELSKSADSQSN
jgi:uncharacterized protein (TIGR02391 family)